MADFKVIIREDNRFGIDAYKLDSIIRLSCTVNILVLVGIIKTDMFSIIINTIMFEDILFVDKDLEKIYKDLDNF